MGGSKLKAHIWEIDLNPGGGRLHRWAGFLSPTENERAGQLRIPQSRRQFTAGRGCLREILGQYLNIDPAEIRFSYNPNGKPYLADPNQAWLKFNLAHSEDRALCIVAQDQEVGIDIEHIHAVQNMSRLVKQFFSPAENQAFHALPENQRQEAFFTTWTCKEAYIKARGLSSANSLRKFDISLTPNAPAKVLADRQHPLDFDKWSLQIINTWDQYKAAFAIKGNSEGIQKQLWE